MIISSKDIKKRDFKKSLRGYDTDEVDAFLETVSNHYEKLIVENRNQAERIKSLLQDIDIYKENELNLQRAIIKSQDLGEQIVENAKRKSELIVREAELNARNVKHNLEDEILARKHELESIKQKNEKTFDDLRNFLTDKLNELDEFFKNRKIITMDLSSVTSLNFNSDDADLDIENDIKPLKNITLSSPKNDRPGTFDESFEIKK
ncbi:MAG: DivIVA domain-containing protein [Candidatus Kapaibacterium sp.]